MPFTNVQTEPLDATDLGTAINQAISTSFNAFTAASPGSPDLVAAAIANAVASAIVAWLSENVMIDTKVLEAAAKGTPTPDYPYENYVLGNAAFFKRSTGFKKNPNPPSADE